MTKYRRKTIEGLELFYREAGRNDAPAIVLLHGFPSSSHMFRNLIPLLARDFHVIAPDYPGFGYSAVPAPSGFSYTFNNLTRYIERLLFDVIGLKKFSLFLQDYGGPIGFRIASRHPQAIDSLIIQNANAYLEGVSSTLAPLQAYWQDRQANEVAVRGFLTADATKMQYLHGAADPEGISPDGYTVDQLFLDRPGNDAVQLDLLFDYQNNISLYPEWQVYFKKQQPRALIVWGQNDPFFTVAGAEAYRRDLKNAEIHLLNTGHFALEEESEAIAQHIRRFLSIEKGKR